MKNFRRSVSPKHQGEQAELRFMLKAMQQGFHVFTPWGDNLPLDFILLGRRRMYRVQVKSTTYLRHCGAYRVHSVFGKKKCALGAGQIDFLVACVLPYDAWYIIPVRFVARHPFVYMRPHLPATKSRWERFRNAWHLLK